MADDVDIGFPTFQAQAKGGSIPGQTVERGIEATGLSGIEGAKQGFAAVGSVVDIQQASGHHAQARQGLGGVTGGAVDIEGGGNLAELANGLCQTGATAFGIAQRLAATRQAALQANTESAQHES